MPSRSTWAGAVDAPRVDKMRGFVIVIALALKAGLSARDDNRRPLVVEAREPSANDELTPGLEEHAPDKHGEFFSSRIRTYGGFTGSSSSQIYRVGAMDMEIYRVGAMDMDFFQKSIVAVPSTKVNLPSTPWVRAASTWKSVETWCWGCSRSRIWPASPAAAFLATVAVPLQRPTPRSPRAFTRPPAPSRGRAADGSEPTADPSAVIDAGDAVAAEA